MGLIGQYPHLDIFENHFRHFGKLPTLKTLVLIYGRGVGFSTLCSCDNPRTEFR